MCRALGLFGAPRRHDVQLWGDGVGDDIERVLYRRQASLVKNSINCRLKGEAVEPGKLWGESSDAVEQRLRNLTSCPFLSNATISAETPTLSRSSDGELFEPDKSVSCRVRNSISNVIQEHPNKHPASTTVFSLTQSFFAKSRYLHRQTCCI